jgi:hypothetical protein
MQVGRSGDGGGPAKKGVTENFPEYNVTVFFLSDNFHKKILMGNFRLRDAKMFVANFFGKYSKIFRAEWRLSPRRTN